MLQVTNLNGYYNDKKVIHNISFQVDKGDIIGYIGPNGSGKTTTIKTILGINENYSGDIFVDGQNIREGISYKQKIGYMPEVNEVFDSFTGFEYLIFTGGLYNIAHEEINNRIVSWVEAFELEEAIHRPMKSYSKGMKQKTLFIGTLLHNPDILFLDEPLSGLDIQSVTLVKHIMKTLSEHGVTIFFSSHILEVVADLSTRILIIKEGSLLFDETIENYHELSDTYNKLIECRDPEKTAKALVNALKEE